MCTYRRNKGLSPNAKKNSACSIDVQIHQSLREKPRPSGRGGITTTTAQLLKIDAGLPSAEP
jgi:hypothetical protein